MLFRSSPRYFESHASQVAQDFKFTAPMSKQTAELAQQIQGVEAVAVHLRLGDYASDPKIKAVHGLLPLDYYRRAAATILERVPRAVFFIFSDDPEYARKNVSLSPNQIVAPSDRSRPDHDDMRLMSLCKHLIIANSTFSWWAAWLCANPSKLVIAPTQWFAGRPNFPDLVPSNWIRV